MGECCEQEIREQAYSAHFQIQSEEGGRKQVRFNVGSSTRNNSSKSTVVVAIVFSALAAVVVVVAVV